MPCGDRTGPFGQGPRTGHGAGFCAGFTMPGNMNPDLGYDFGRWGYCRGSGRRHGLNRFGTAPWLAPTAAPPTPSSASMSEQELQGLKAQAEWLQAGLEKIRKRIEELETKAKE